MKLLYIKLVNYIGILIGTGRTVVEVDFTKSTSPLTMLLGPNGCGKTTLMSTFHPLAEVIDDDKKSIIIEGEDGEKHFHAMDDNGNIFYVVHYHKAEGATHSIKSYISKYNAVTGTTSELNQNGNRGSFHTILFEEMGVDSAYLKLSSMGVNMTSFIRLKASERKKFMSNILSETDIFAQYYKKVTIKSRDSKSLINSLTSKISRLPDKSILDMNLYTADQELTALKTSKETILTKMASLKTQIEIYDPDSRLLNEYNQVKLGWGQAHQIYQKLRNGYNISDDRIQEGYKRLFDGIINELERTKVYLTQRIGEFTTTVQNDNIRLEEYRGRLREKQALLRTFQSTGHLDDLVSIRTEMSSEIDRLLHLKCLTNVSESDLRDLSETLTKVENVTSSIYTEYSEDMINKGCQYVIEGTHIPSLYAELKQLSSMRERDLIHLSQLSARIEIIANNGSQLSGEIPMGCKNPGCPYIPVNKKKQLDIEIQNLISERNKLESDLQDYDFRVEISAGALKVAEMVSLAWDLVSANSSLLSFCDRKDTELYYPIINLCENIMVRRSFASIGNLEAYEEAIENGNLYTRLVTMDIPKIEADIAIARNNEGAVAEINKDISVILSDIGKLDASISNVKNELINMNSELETTSTSIAFYSNLMTLKEADDKFRQYDSEKIKLENSLSNILNLQKEMETLNVELQGIIERARIKQNELKDIEFQQGLYVSYHRELEEVRGNYVYIEYIKEALSTSEGIPVEIIQEYLDDTKRIANDLLQYAFAGELIIHKIHVDEDDFNIICNYNGRLINDVALLSGGQKAIISLVFSVALIRQMSSVYNIFLLDEIDGVLDEENREAFLFMLENIIRALNVQSVNIISHNNAFDSYDVNLILFRDTQTIAGKNILTVL